MTIDIKEMEMQEKKLHKRIASLQVEYAKRARRESIKRQFRNLFLKVAIIMAFLGLVFVLVGLVTSW